MAAGKLMKPPFREALLRGLRFRCPKCGMGEVFSSFFKIRESCEICGLSYYPESGYYAGAMYLDYALSAAFFLAVYIPTLFLPAFIHFSYYTADLLWIAFGAVLCLSLARPSYSLWLAIDYWITPWKSDVPLNKKETLEVPLVSLIIRSDGNPQRPDDPREN